LAILVVVFFRSDVLAYIHLLVFLCILLYVPMCVYVIMLGQV